MIVETRVTNWVGSKRARLAPKWLFLVGNLEKRANLEPKKFSANPCCYPSLFIAFLLTNIFDKTKNPKFGGKFFRQGHPEKENVSVKRRDKSQMMNLIY